MKLVIIWRDKFVNSLCDSEVWRQWIIALAAGGSIAAFFTDPKIQACIFPIGYVCSRPIAKFIARQIIRYTDDFQTTPTKLDDIANAAAKGLLDADIK